MHIPEDEAALHEKDPAPIVNQPVVISPMFDEHGFDLSLPEDPSPGPFVISPFTAGKYRPRPGQIVAHGL